MMAISKFIIMTKFKMAPIAKRIHSGQNSYISGASKPPRARMKPL